MSDDPDALKATAKRDGYLVYSKLRDQGGIDGAKKKLEELTVSFPDFWQAWMTLGAFLDNESKYDAAANCFSHAAKLQPSREKVSLCLFHSLTSAGRVDEAIVEARRFLDEIRKGAPYDATTIELYVDWDNDGHAIYDAMKQ